MILEGITVGPMQTNCYILSSGRGLSAIIIDPGSELNKINKILDKHKLKPAFVINTHGHFDHIGCDDKFGVPVYIHKQDLAMLQDAKLNYSASFALPYHVKSETIALNEGDYLKLDDISLRVMHTPGHSPGGITLLLEKPVDKIAFTGDTLFCQGIGRSDFAGGDESLLIKSIKEKILTLPEETVIYPGHGGSSTVGMEKKNNLFLL